MIQYSERYRWSDIRELPDKNQPGVYFIAYSEEDLTGQSYSLIKDIIYIGVSISKKGVYARLYQFKKAMNSKVIGLHGGAERVRVKYPDSTTFFKETYVATLPFPTTGHNLPGARINKCSSNTALRDIQNLFGEGY